METDGEGHRRRLRERFEKSGFDGFHDHEALELLLTYVIPRKDVKPLSKELLRVFKSFSAVLDAPAQELRRVEGIGDRAAVLLSIIPRLSAYYQQDRFARTTVFRSTSDAVNTLSALLATERNEFFYVLALNSSNALIATEKIQQGTVNRTAVFPRLVVEAGLRHRAVGLILAHNHPGGDPTPSDADRRLTQKLKKILSELDILVHDHIIIAGPNYYSFAENGGLDEC